MGINPSLIWIFQRSSSAYRLGINTWGTKNVLKITRDSRPKLNSFNEKHNVLILQNEPDISD
jgi:hypothetical protein